MKIEMKNIKMVDLRYLFGGGVIVSAMLLLASCGSSTEENTSEGVGTVEIMDTGNAEETVSGGSVGVLDLESDSYDFGKVTEGTRVEHVFTFINTGEAPLIISQVLHPADVPHQSTLRIRLYLDRKVLSKLYLIAMVRWDNNIR